MTSLATTLTDTVGRHPDRIALRLEDSEWTYAQFDELTRRVAGHLAEVGVEPGDRIGLMLPNIVQFPVIYYGILRAGGVVVPMNPLLKSREITHYLGDAGAELAFVIESGADEARQGSSGLDTEIVAVNDATMDEIAGWPLGPAEPVARADDDTAIILYTSGTTGSPKGAQLTHSNMRRNAVGNIELYGMSPDDVIVGCLPLFHAFGQTCALNTSVAVGSSLVLIPRFDPDLVLKVIERDRVTVFMGVPTMYVAMLAKGRIADTSTLRMCASGGAALPVEVLKGFSDTFGAQILEGYGLSETSPVASFNRLGNTRAGSIGHPIDGTEMRVVDESGAEVPTGEVGEIVIKGHNVMKGYWNRPEATAEAIKDGWFHTGDMARKDDDGFFFIVDRKKELIIRGGFNIYPREIEEVLYEHPAVLEAAVIGVPHPTHGEEVAAAVALKEGASAEPDELREYVKARVAAYKYPRHVWLVDALPKGPTGKILKREISQPAS